MTVEQIPLQRAKFRTSPVMEHVIAYGFSFSHFIVKLFGLL